jgi:hypothetical protein
MEEYMRLYLDSDQIFDQYGIALDANIEIAQDLKVNAEKVEELVKAGQDFYDAGSEIQDHCDAFCQQHETFPARASDEQKQSLEYQQLLNAEAKQDMALTALTSLKKLGYHLIRV